MRTLPTSGAIGLVIVAQLVAVAFLLGIIWVRQDWPLPLAYLLILVPTAAVFAMGGVVALRVLKQLPRRLREAWERRGRR